MGVELGPRAAERMLQSPQMIPPASRTGWVRTGTFWAKRSRRSEGSVGVSTHLPMPGHLMAAMPPQKGPAGGAGSQAPLVQRPLAKPSSPAAVRTAT